MPQATLAGGRGVSRPLLIVIPDPHMVGGRGREKVVVSRCRSNNKGAASSSSSSFGSRAPGILSLRNAEVV